MSIHEQVVNKINEFEQITDVVPQEIHMTRKLYNKYLEEIGMVLCPQHPRIAGITVKIHDDYKPDDWNQVHVV